jgi:purine-binding chemotaxis protein CheW
VTGPDDAALTAAELRAAFDAGFAEPAARPVPQVDVLAIHAGGAPYAIARSELAALRVDLVVVDLPSPAPALIGVAAVRGELVAVWDLGRLTHGEPVRARRWCAIARGGRSAVAFDRLDAHLRVPLPLGASLVFDHQAYPVLDLAGVLARQGASHDR